MRRWIPDPTWGFFDGKNQDAQVVAREELDKLAPAMAEIILELRDRHHVSSADSLWARIDAMADTLREIDT